MGPLLVKLGFTPSNAEANRKIKEGAVQLDGNKVTDFQQSLAVTAPVVVKLGKRFARLVPG